VAASIEGYAPLMFVLESVRISTTALVGHAVPQYHAATGCTFINQAANQCLSNKGNNYEQLHLLAPQLVRHQPLRTG